jgi:hypothetical protein
MLSACNVPVVMAVALAAAAGAVLVALCDVTLTIKPGIVKQFKF